MRLPAVRGARTAVLTAALVAVVSLAGCATTSEPAADTGKETDAPVEQPTEEASSLAERTIDTPYYTVVVPESWRGVLAYEYGDTYTDRRQKARAPTPSWASATPRRRSGTPRPTNRSA